jgi:hypothetical protein
MIRLGVRISYLFGGYNNYSNSYRLTNQLEESNIYSSSIYSHNYNTYIINNVSK